MKFYLGTHEVGQKWWDAAVPLFVSRVRLEKRKTLPRATEEWALDSGGFSELSLRGRWEMPAEQYAAFVRRCEREIGMLVWAAPQDWMCEPHVLARTGKTIRDHQNRTVYNYLVLREQLGDMVIPVLQGWSRDDYLRCVELYVQMGVDLWDAHTVGLGTICRRQNTPEAGKIVRSLGGLRLHGFGVKIAGLASFGDALVSADSMAWSFDARRAFPMQGCTHKNCANCLKYALRWRDRVHAQQRMEVTTA